MELNQAGLCKCHKCGSDHVLIDEVVDWDSGYVDIFVSCQKCGLQMKSCGYDDFLVEDKSVDNRKQELVHRWNTPVEKR